MDTRNIPELFRRKTDCMGCGACACLCPAKAISMEPDEEGFLYPLIDIERCVGCLKCLSVCPLKQN